MRLRTILLVLSLLAFFSASAAGYLYFSSSKQSALKGADDKAALSAETIRDRLTAHLNEYMKSARVLSGLKDVRALFSTRSPDAILEANSILDHFQRELGVDVCYVMDEDGITVASSNRNDPDSFVGENYAFRPYYRKAMEGKPSIYMARGVTSKKRGVYYSHPVYGKDQGNPAGVLVIKASVDLIEKEFRQDREGIVALVEPGGLIFITNRDKWLFHFLWKPLPEEINRASYSRQFGEGPFPWTGLERIQPNQAFDSSQREYAVYLTPLEKYPGWSVVYLQDTDAVSRGFSFRFIRMTGLAILAFCACTGVFIFFLYRKASFHIAQRKTAEQALRAAKEEVTRYSKDLEDRVEKRTEELRRLSASIMSGQEKERTAIARELHDELGQMLTALRFEAVWLWEHLRGNDPKAAERATDMCSLIDQSIDEVRGMSIRLRPGVLDDLGLIAALEWYTSDFEKRTGIECSFRQVNVGRIQGTLATAAYRIAQEALTNVARHSRASRASVDLECWDGVLTLCVRDNGRGFGDDALSKLGNVGIAGMRERSSLVGGSLRIHATPGRGAEVVFRAPLFHEEELQ